MIQSRSVERQSNLELLRIITMLVIVAHHYVVNSGIDICLDLDAINAKTIFLQLWGMWGKTGINIFILISGYFMCKSNMTWKRYSKVFCEAMFYRIIIYVVFVIAGYEVITGGRLFELIFGFLKSANNGFTSSFLMFYIFVPFYNLMINHMDKKKHQMLLGLLFFMYTICGTFFFNYTIFSEVGWYMTLYFTGAYMNLYPSKWTSSVKVGGLMTAVSVALAMLSVIVIDFFGVKFGFTNAYYMVNDSNKLLALMVAASVFILFKNLDLGKNKYINAISATTFGVFCIHTSSNAMRIFLWQDLLHVPEAYAYPGVVLVLHAVGSMFAVFIVCSLIDMIRIKFIEKPFFALLEKRFNY